MLDEPVQQLDHVLLLDVCSVGEQHPVIHSHAPLVQLVLADGDGGDRVLTTRSTLIISQVIIIIVLSTMISRLYCKICYGGSYSATRYSHSIGNIENEKM